MGAKKDKKFNPVISLLLIILTMFTIVFTKMEIRRTAYNVLKISDQYKKKHDIYRYNMLEYAKVTQPDRVRSYALSQLTMTEAGKGQIIHISNDNLLVAQ